MNISLIISSVLKTRRIHNRWRLSHVAGSEIYSVVENLQLILY